MKREYTAEERWALQLITNGLLKIRYLSKLGRHEERLHDIQTIADALHNLPNVIIENGNGGFFDLSEELKQAESIIDKIHTGINRD